MPLPIIIVIERTLRIVADSMDSWHQKEVAVAQMRLQARIEELRNDLAKEKEKTRREVLLRMLDLAQHVFDRKMDLIVAAFQDMSTQIALTEDSLRQRLASVQTMWNESVAQNDAARASLISPEMTQLRDDLVDIRRVKLEVDEDYLRASDRLKLELGNTGLPLAIGH